MKIALIHTQYKQKGGMESCLFDVIRGMFAEGHTVDLWVHKVDPTAPALDGLTVHHVAVSKWVPRRMKQYAFYRRLERVLPRASYDLTLSFCRSHTQDAVVCGGTHEGFLQHTGKRRKISDWMQVRAERQAYESSEWVIAHSQMMKNEIVQFYDIPEEKIQVILPPTDGERFVHRSQLDRAALRKKLGMPESKPVLLFPSTGHKRKGYFELIEAMRLVDAEKVELWVVGDSAPQPCRLQQVRHLGFVSNLPEYLAAADLMILPSHYEPYGLVVVEALACGTPAIVSRYVGAAELIGKGEGEVLSDLQPKTIAEAISKSLSATYDVKPGFIARNRLGVSDHVQALQELHAMGKGTHMGRDRG